MDDPGTIVEHLQVEIERLVDEVAAQLERAGVSYYDDPIDEPFEAAAWRSTSEKVAAFSVLMATSEEGRPQVRYRSWRPGLVSARHGEPEEVEEFIADLERDHDARRPGGSVDVGEDDFIHGVNVLRGWLQLRRGDVDGAVKSLSAASALVYAPTARRLPIFEVDITLAIALLRVGREAAALDYFRRMAPFLEI